ncbi:MAG: hypothetical protein U1F25_04255 [Rubrivivax sp.]
MAPLTAALVVCAAVAVPDNTSGEAREAVLARWASPTARYAMPAGGERLEYASGPFGRTTWMIDIDTGGRVPGPPGRCSTKRTSPNCRVARRP